MRDSAVLVKKRYTKLEGRLVIRDVLVYISLWMLSIKCRCIIGYLRIHKIHESAQVRECCTNLPLRPEHK